MPYIKSITGNHMGDNFEKIKSNLLRTDCVLFLGSGATATSKLKNGNLCPTGNKLAEIVYKHFFPKEAYSNESLQVICSIIDSTLGSNILHEFFYDFFKEIIPSKGLHHIAKIRWHNIYTTNIDLALETAYSIEQDKAQFLIPVVGPMDKGSRDLKTEVAYNKLHGCISRKDVPLVFSLEQYSSSREEHMKLFAKLSVDMVDKPIIFIGYSMQDSDFQSVWDSIKKYCSTTTLTDRYFYISPKIKDPFSKYLLANNIIPCEISIDDFGEWLVATTKGQRLSLTEFHTKNRTPIEIFNKVALPPEITYEISKNYYFPKYEISKPLPLTKSFFIGTEPDWNDIKYELDAPRDILPPILLDFDEWYNNPTLSIWVITGRAGDGKSTLLKRLSLEIANRVGDLALFAKTKADLNPSILTTFQKETEKPLIIFIDNIADRFQFVSYFYKYLKIAKAKILILGAGRTSDWQLACDNISIFSRAREYPIGKLTDNEIEAILDKLNKFDSLGELISYDNNKRKEYFSGFAERELLVALREATTGGKNFDEIIVNEYSSIKPPVAVDAYKTICFINQFRYGLPRDLLIRILEITYDQLPDIFKYTEGIIYENETPGNVDYLLTARHSVIASIISKNIYRTDTAKLEILKTIVNKAIPSSHLESSLVKKLYQYVTINSLFESYETGRNCYEELSEILPLNPYLKQHEALYHSLKGNFEGARDSVTSIMQILKKGIILNGLNNSLKGRKENYTHEKFIKEVEKNH